MQSRIQFTRIPISWPERILAGVIAILLLFLGLAFGAVILSLAVLTGLGFAARLWWLRRRLLRTAPRSDETVIEGEYRVIRQRTADRSNDEEI